MGWIGNGNLADMGVSLIVWRKVYWVLETDSGILPIRRRFRFVTLVKTVQFHELDHIETPIKQVLVRCSKERG